MFVYYIGNLSIQFSHPQQHNSLHIASKVDAGSLLYPLLQHDGLLLDGVNERGLNTVGSSISACLQCATKKIVNGIQVR